MRLGIKEVPGTVMIYGLNKFFSSGEKKSLLRNWQDEGFVVLKNFFKPEQLNAFDLDVRRIISKRDSLGGDVTIDVLDGNLKGSRLRLKQAPDEAINSTHKINDLYLESESCRDLCLDKGLCKILEDLLAGQPTVINSLTFTKGSQQPHHFDTYYMPPPVQGMMAVSSICLEDQSEQSGPLTYYPGSHNIKPYEFSHGGIHAVKDEMEQATDFVMSEISKRGLREETFVGNAGDVFIWHGQLYHGGKLILDHDQTRKTLVTHYWRRQDLDESKIKSIGGGNILVREHPEVRD